MPLQNDKPFVSRTASLLSYITHLFSRENSLIIFTRTTLVLRACRSGERKMKTQLEKFLNSRVYIHGILGFLSLYSWNSRILEFIFMEF